MHPSFPFKRVPVLALVLAAGVLGGCALRPNTPYRTPTADIPRTWEQPSVTGNAMANGEPWWRGFNDPVLNTLIDRALRTNNDLAAATIKVRLAWLQSSLTNTNRTPSASVSADSSIGRYLKDGTHADNYDITGALSYEVDLWGRLAKLRDAGRWEAEATEADRQNTALALIGTTASAYWKIAYLNQRIALGRASIAYAEKTLALVRVKYRAGAVSDLARVQALENVSTQKADLTRWPRQRDEARHALSILFNQPPERHVAERSALPDGPLPKVPAGIPADILSRRPDLRAAERRLRESLANVDAVRASFYPTVNLTGSLGGTSTSLEDVLRNPVAALGAGLVLPFVEWPTTRLTIRVSETEYEEAVVNFRQTLYQALSDVETALSARTRYDAESLHLEQVLALAKKAERLAETRYRAGAVPLQDWLDAQEDRRTAEANLAENRLNRLNAAMTLYQALGGDMKSDSTPASQRAKTTGRKTGDSASRGWTGG